MKHLSFLLIICFMACNALYGQSPTFSNSLQVNLNFIYDDLSEFEEFSIGQWAVAWGIFDQKGNRHLIELNRLRFSDRVQTRTDSLGNITAGGRSRELDLRFRYQYTWMLGNSENALRPYLSMSPVLGYAMNHYNPRVSTEFKHFFQELSIRMEAGAGIFWQLTERVFLDLQIPWEFTSLSFLYNRSQHPSLPIDQQSVSSFNFELLGYQIPQLRLGSGISF